MGKLVRDNIPEMMRRQGKTPRITELHGQELLDSLKAKLLEEAGEVSESQDKADMAEELADVLEVAEALSGAAGIPMDEISSIKSKKKMERGGFGKGFYLH